MKRMIALFLVLVFALPLVANTCISKADSLYGLRGKDFDAETLLADTTQIMKAVRVYSKALENAEGAVREEIAWKLMKAYYFLGEYCTHDNEVKKEVFNLGIEVGKKELEEFPESVGLNLWSGVLWGVWGNAYGKVAAAKKGAAGKIRQYSEKTIELDKHFNDAAGYRVLGRLHFAAPKIPLILGWPSKKKAVEYLEKANEIAPNHIVTTLYLAEALYARDQKERAVELLNKVLSMGEEQGVAEAAVAKSDAKGLLEEWGE